MARKAILIGSLPAGNATAAMTEALRELGPYLRALPDGETGDRNRWVAGTVESFRANPDLAVRREGDFADYRRTPNFAVRKGHTLTGESLDLRIARFFTENWPIFTRIRAAHGRPELAFQVGVPGDFDTAMFALGPLGALRHRKAFTDATVREIEQVHSQAGDDVVFQLELCAELVFVTRTPSVLRELVAALLARFVGGLIRRLPRDARFGVHLCLGDLGHQALGIMRDAGPVVQLANALSKAWPAGPRLEYVHGALAAGELGPPLDPAFYRPLAGLRLPGSTRFVAGFLHERRSTKEARTILGLIESSYGRDVDVAAACGLGRRGQANALVAMRQAADLCAAGNTQPSAVRAAQPSQDHAGRPVPQLAERRRP